MLWPVGGVRDQHSLKSIYSTARTYAARWSSWGSGAGPAWSSATGGDGGLSFWERPWSTHIPPPFPSFALFAFTYPGVHTRIQTHLRMIFELNLRPTVVGDSRAPTRSINSSNNLFGLLIPWLVEMSLKRTVWYKTMSRHTSFFPPRFLHLKKKTKHIFFVKV